MKLRRIRVSIDLTPEEFERVAAAADWHGSRVVEYAKACVVGQSSFPLVKTVPHPVYDPEPED